MNFLAATRRRTASCARRWATCRSATGCAGSSRSADAPSELIVGIRPEHFEDASLIEDSIRERGVEFEAPADLVESMGSDKYVYFTIEGEKATSAELEELAADAGGGRPARRRVQPGDPLLRRVPGPRGRGHAGSGSTWRRSTSSTRPTAAT